MSSEIIDVPQKRRKIEIFGRQALLLIQKKKSQMAGPGHMKVWICVDE